MLNPDTYISVMVNPDNIYNSQLDETQSEYQRNLARQRQLEHMEAAATGTSSSMQLDNFSSEPQVSGLLQSGGSEAARQFLYDDDEKLDAALRASTTAATSQPGIPVRTLFERRDEECFKTLNLMDHETGDYGEQMTFGERMTNSFFGGIAIGRVMSPKKKDILTEDGYYSRGHDRGEGRVNICVGAYHELKSDKRKSSLLLFVLIAVLLVIASIITVGNDGSPREEIDAGSTFVDPGISNGGSPVDEGGEAVKIEGNSGITNLATNGDAVAGSIDEIRQKGEGFYSEERLREENSARFNEILDLLLLDVSKNVQSFLNNKSPEYMALRWISYTDKADIDPKNDPDDIIKRYVLAVFYYNSYITFEAKVASQKSISNLANHGEQFTDVPDSGWTRKDYWLSEKGVCLWYGVTCESYEIDGQLQRYYDGNGNITRIRLPDNNVYGYLPSEFEGLEHITAIDLSENHLTGTFPIGMGRLFKLEFLSLQNNEINGRIPADVGNLNSMKELDMGNNKLTGSLPMQMGYLSHLQILSLENNELTGTIPSTLGQLDALHTFSVHHNKLHKGIPTEIGGMNAMKKFHTQNNALTGTIPTEVGQMSDLEEFWAMENTLEGGIPTEFGDLRRLKSLYLENNALAESVPSELANIASLTTFRLHGNSIQGTMPPEICDFHDNQYSALKYISADCLESSEKITCGCCDECY